MCAREIEKPKYDIVGELERFNEADQAMSRGDMVPDSERWRAYYDLHPELEKLGRVWANLPEPDKILPAQDISILASLAESINLLSTEEAVDGDPAQEKVFIPPERAKARIKGLARHLGAHLVRTAPLNPAWVYSHVGRDMFGCKVIGKPIDLPHQNAIVIAMPLDIHMVSCAPRLPIILETLKTYLHLASIVVALAKHIRMLGYPARAHNLWNYQVLLVPLAVDAGLGELARNGVLITSEYGNAVKLAAVTTDMPLSHDSPVDIGVEEFCSQCHICADHCPSGAISTGDKTVVRGVRKWKLNDAACFTYFKHVGTDCGVCMAVCPWTRSRGWPHNWVLNAVERSNIARKVAIKVDSKLGRRKKGELPSWIEAQPDA